MAVPEAFCWSWSQMVQYNAEYACEPNERIHYVRSTFSFHAAGRNALVDQTLGEWLLMIDTDHSFEPDLLARMLLCMEQHKIDVLTALYQFKNPPHIPIVYRKNGEAFIPIADWEKPIDLFPVDSAGAGSLLIRQSVFQHIKHELKCGPFDILPPYGEDHSFFKRIEQLGIKAYCCPNIQSYHLQVKPVSLTDYDPSQFTLERVEAEARVLREV